jgi:hypothetical protein
MIHGFTGQTDKSKRQGIKTNEIPNKFKSLSWEVNRLPVSEIAITTDKSIKSNSENEMK